MISKDFLRKKYKSAESLDESIAARIMHNIENYIEANEPNLVGIYLPLRGEADITSLMIKYPNVKFAAPKIENEQIFFVRHFLTSPIEKSKDYDNYLQPVSTEEVYPDMIFIPAIAFDIRGFRLGKGKGHYDKYLQKNQSKKVGLIDHSKILEFIPNEDHDQKMDIIISEEVIIDLCKC